MQVDDRNYYSIDILMEKKKSGLKLPDVTQFKNPQNFFAGTNEDVMLNYSTAKFIVHGWLQTHSLKIFIKAINAGEDFENAWQKKAE